MKRIITILMVAMLVVTLIGCGKTELVHKEKSQNSVSIEHVKSMQSKKIEEKKKLDDEKFNNGKNKELKDEKSKTKSSTNESTKHKGNNLKYKLHTFKEKHTEKTMKSDYHKMLKLKKQTNLDKGKYVFRDTDVEDGEEELIEAMYVPIGESYVFIGNNNVGVFVIKEDSQIYDINGDEISLYDLRAGNIVEIQSSGIMLTSYPGQLTGVKTVHVIRKGKPEDIFIYNDIIEQLTPQHDEEEIPLMTVQYSNRHGDVSVSVENNGNYHWGTGEGEVEDSLSPISPTKIFDYVDVNIDENTTATISFSEEVKNIVVRKILIGTDNFDGEEVEITDDNEIEIEPAIYMIDVEFENGNVSYSFVCKLCK